MSIASIDNSKKIVLTEQEKLRRKEDIARRRKLQADQKQENDKVSRRLGSLHLTMSR